MEAAAGPDRGIDALILATTSRAALARPQDFVSTGSALFDNITIGYLLGHGSDAAIP